MNDSVQGVRASALFEGEGPIRVVPWPDPVADASGFAAASAMVEWTGTEVRFDRGESFDDTAPRRSWSGGVGGSRRRT